MLWCNFQNKLVSAFQGLCGLFKIWSEADRCVVQADTGWEGEIEIVSDRLSGGEFLLHAPCWNLFDR